MKKAVMKILTGLMAALMCVSFVSCAKKNGENTDSSANGAENQQISGSGASGFFTLDINPSVEFIVKDGKVADIKASNKDATVLLSGENLVGLTVEEASEKVTALAEKMGYLNENNKKVKINVLSDDETQKGEIENAAKNGTKKGSDIAEINTASRTHENRIVKELQAKDPELYKDLNAEKVRLIESIMAYDKTMTMELGATMDVKTLLDIYDEVLDDYEDLISDELEDKFEMLYGEKTAELDKKINEVMADAYATLHKDDKDAKAKYMSAYSAAAELEKVLENIENSAENAKLSDEDTNAVLKALSDFAGKEVALDDIKDEDGNVTEDSIENYMDKNFDSDELDEKSEDALDALEDAIDEILDKYDEDNYVLSAEERKLVLDILAKAGVDTKEIPEKITLEELEEYEEPVEEAFEDMEEEAEDALSDEQKKQIEEIESQKDEIKAQVLEEMKDEIKAEQEAVANQKKEKLEEK